MTHDNSRQAVLILGMHRSGTSALTRLISFMGYALPQTLMPSLVGNELGHWESDVIAHYNDNILNELHLNWYDWHAYNIEEIAEERKSDIIRELSLEIQKEYPGNDNFVLKDPRVCRLTSFVIPALRSLSIDVKIVIPIRHPLEVVESLHKRNGISRAECALIWLRYSLEAEYGSREQRRVFIRYEDYLKEPENAVLSILKNLSLDVEEISDDQKRAIREFSRPDLKHHNFTITELEENPLTNGWVSTSFSILSDLIKNPNCQKAQNRLDKLREEFEKVAPIIRQSLDAYKIKSDLQIQSDKDTILKIQKQNEKLLKRSLVFEDLKKQHKTQQEDMRVKIDNKQIAIENLQKKLSDLQSKFVVTQQRLIDKTEKVKERNSELKALKSEIQHLKSMGNNIQGTSKTSKTKPESTESKEQTNT